MRYALVFAILGVLVSWWVVAHGTSHTNIEVVDLWAHETGGARAELHMRISNRGAKGDHLLSLSSGLAKKISVLDHLGREIDTLRIPADAELVLGGGPLRIEAIGVTRPLKARDNFPLLLVFEHAGKMKVNVRVEITGVSGLSVR
jgi:copper(I)-binding protein